MAFCETVVETSSLKCFAETPNKKWDVVLWFSLLICLDLTLCTCVFSAFRLLRSPMTCIALRPSILPPLIPAVCAGANLMFWCMRSIGRETIYSFHFMTYFFFLYFKEQDYYDCRTFGERLSWGHWKWKSFNYMEQVSPKKMDDNNNIETSLVKVVFWAGRFTFLLSPSQEKAWRIFPN